MILVSEPFVLKSEVKESTALAVELLFNKVMTGAVV